MIHDATREEDWARVVDKAVARHGGLHVLVNNAGVFLERSIEEMTIEEWRWLSAVNLEGVFLGTKHAIRAMKASCPKGGPSGSIINLSSVAGIVGSPMSSAYSMSKGGVRLFTKSAALECASLGYNIRVNSVHPGIIETDMIQQVARKMMKLNDTEDYDKAWKDLDNFQPIGRKGRADEVAKGVVFLASEDSSLMTGAELVLDGGITAK
jgi:NAD(P)-dependent dehydrogenase (short-subunit alcohol dehydrogenase family)